MRIRQLQPGEFMYLEDPLALRGWIKYRGMSYKDLGDLVGVSRQFIHKLCAGTKRTCRPELAQRIEQVLLPPVEQRTPRERPLFIVKQSQKRVPERRHRKSVEERFFRFVNRRGPKECWPWLGATTRGYGQFSVGGKRQSAHRVAYELFVGPIPPGLHLDHVAAKGCTRRDCVNPAHLQPVTPQENVARYSASATATKRRELLRAIRLAETHCQNGHEYAAVGVYPLRSSATGYVCAQCERDRARERYALAKQKRLANPAVSKLLVDGAPVLSEGPATLQATGGAK